MKKKSIKFNGHKRSVNKIHGIYVCVCVCCVRVKITKLIFCTLCSGETNNRDLRGSARDKSNRYLMILNRRYTRGTLAVETCLSQRKCFRRHQNESVGIDCYSTSDDAVQQNGVPRSNIQFKIALFNGVELARRLCAVG